MSTNMNLDRLGADMGSVNSWFRIERKNSYIAEQSFKRWAKDNDLSFALLFSLYVTWQQGEQRFPA